MSSGRPQTPVLEVTGISKSFGPVRANDEISFSVQRGEILGLLGENGAGKSTLLSILAGLQPADSGTIRVGGRPVHISSSASAIRNGISLVHQHFSLVPTFTVEEQLRLGGWRRSSLPAIIEGDIPADARIDQLAPGQQQRVELAKALIHDPQILLLDEPTSILAPSEVAGLFATLAQLRDTGTAIVFVTHKIREVIAHADRIIVLRRGRISRSVQRVAGAWPTGTERQIVEAMFEVRDPFIAPAGARETASPPESPPALVGRHLATTGTAGAVGLQDVDVAVRPGEVHAVVGIDGQGQGTLADVLAGYRTASGDIRVAGQSMAGLGATAFAEAGVGLITGERLLDGGIATFTVAENLRLKRQRSPEFAGRGLFRKGNVDALACAAIQEWNIQPPDPAYPFGSLSGGNMQKVLLAREFARRPLVVIAVNPVAGLDLQTALDVRTRLRAFVRDGGAALWFTNDLDDAVAVAGTISVMFEGRLSPEIPVQDASLHRVSEMMVSGW